MSYEEDDIDYEKFRKNLDLEKVNWEIDDLQTHPLFLNDQEKINQSKDQNFEALRSLMYDEDPETVAKNLLQQGNKIMNEKLKTEGLLQKGESYYLKQAWEKY